MFSLNLIFFVLNVFVLNYCKFKNVYSLNLNFFVLNYCKFKNNPNQTPKRLWHLGSPGDQSNAGYAVFVVTG